MQDSTFFVLIAFVCLMTGLFTPDTMIRKKGSTKKSTPLIVNGILVFAVLATGFASFFSGMDNDSSDMTENPAAFVFFDQSTHEKVGVYRIAQTSFSNHLLLQIQTRTVVDADSVQLEILLTNTLDEAFNFNPDFLHIVDEAGQQVAPIGMIVDGDHVTREFPIQAGESVLGTFLYLKPSDNINFEIKYLPINS